MDQKGAIPDERIVMLTIALNGGTASLDIDNGIGFTSIPLETDGVQNIFVRPCAYQITTTGGALVGIS
jgi:hypothetical protein